MMINRVVLVGRLTVDPELRYTPNGIAVSRFTLAVNRNHSNKNGDYETDFIPVIVWRRQAETAAEYLKKGNLAGIDGRIQTRSYEKDGRRVYVTEVVAESVQFLEPKGARSDKSVPCEPMIDDPSTDEGNNPFASGDPIDISDDDLPF